MCPADDDLQAGSPFFGQEISGFQPPLGEEIYCLIARPFDASLTATYPAPPWPFGKISAGFDSSLDFDIVGGEIEVYASAGRGAYRSRASDAPASTVFPPRLLQIFNFEVHLFGSAPELSPSHRAGFGEIILDNSDGTFDASLALGWDGRTIDLYRGDSTFAFATFTLIFKGTCEGLETTENSIILRLRDREQFFDVSIQQEFYGGTGGYDGGSNLAGKPRPQAYGGVFNVAPLLIDDVNLVWQWHDRQVSSVTSVRDRGAALAATSDYATYADLIAATIAGGSYATCNAFGLVRTGASPVGMLTLNGAGDAAGGFVQTTADIIRRIVQTRLGNSNMTDADLDLAAFTQLNTDQPVQIGVYIDQVRNVSAVIDDLLRAIGSWRTMTLPGKLTLGQFKTPTAGGPSFKTAAQGSLRRIARPLPSYVRHVGYNPVWQVQSPTDLVAPPTITESDRAFWGQRLRYATIVDNAVQVKHRLARDVRIDGFFTGLIPFNAQQKASDEAVRQQALFGTDRTVTTVNLNGADPFALTLGQSVNVQLIGDSVGVDYRLIDLVANVSRDELTVTLWK